MDYTKAPLLFRVRKVVRYLGLYGFSRTLIKVRGQYHMKKKYEHLPENHVRTGSGAHVGMIGCGNYGFAVIAYYLRKKYGQVIRGCMDADINRAASLFEEYKACYYTAHADEIIADPKIRLIYISSNHASHAEYAIKALAAGKDVHIEKPHVVTEDQLERLCDAVRSGTGRVVSIGFNRPHSVFGHRMREKLWSEQGDLMQNWFVAGHRIEPDHWYFKQAEGGRILGNLCHWTDLTYQMMPPERRYPIRILPARAVKADSDISVTYIFGDGSIGTITFSAKGHAFEGVKERYAAHRGSTLIAMDDFSSLVIDVGPKKFVWNDRVRDHGHERSVTTSYARSADPRGQGLDVSYLWEAAQLFLKTKEALELSQQLTLSAWEEPLAAETRRVSASS